MQATIVQVFWSFAALLCSSAAFAQTTCANITSAEIYPVGGNAYIVVKNVGFLGDTTQAPQQSQLVLRENGKSIGPAHTQLATIQQTGRGRYLHWGNEIYFSSSDNTDPRTNGRQYSIAGPCRVTVQFALQTLATNTPGYATFQSHNQKVVQNAYGIFAVYADSATTDPYETRQRWTLLRSVNGGQSFQVVARGANSVRTPTLETDEFGNLYLFDSKVTACDPPLPPHQITRESGNAFITVQNFGFAGDTNEQPTRSILRVLEDGLEMGAPHTQHATIRSVGGGTYSHWYNTLYFSTSDNSDPTVNGRRYTLTTLSPGCLQSPLTSSEIFHEQGFAYIVPRQFGFEGDASNTSECPTCATRSNLRLFENGVEIGPAHTQHQTIRQQGGGAFSHWYSQLYFSASDNTNPATNLRTYAYTGGQASLSSEAVLYKFGPSNNFARPLKVKYIPGGASGKYTSFYDRTSGRLYYAAALSQIPSFFTFDRETTLLSSRPLTKGGPNGYIQYPHIFAEGPDVYAAWTNQAAAAPYWYRGIHAIRSRDGGASWTNLADQPVALPVVADDTGPSTMISLPSEINTSTWLSTLALRDRKLHFFYFADVTGSFPCEPLNAGRQRYVRFNLDIRQFDIHRCPFAALNSEILGLDGFYAQKRGGRLLYAVAAKRGEARLSVVESDDNGVTWIEHAVSGLVPAGYGIYSIGGSRWITDDGYLIGTFTQTGPDRSVKFFRVKVRE